MVSGWLSSYKRTAGMCTGNTLLFNERLISKRQSVQFIRWHVKHAQHHLWSLVHISIELRLESIIIRSFVRSFVQIPSMLPLIIVYYLHSLDICFPPPFSLELCTKFHNVRSILMKCENLLPLRCKKKWIELSNSYGFMEMADVLS